ncbi:MAG UNVERIFIED_CONTAM: hypothetical protein LVR18_23205 [Planctomycetaceae bacterium]
MRLSALLLASSLSLCLTGCCLSIDGGRDSGFQSSRHGDGCQCPQHSHASLKPSSSKSIRPVRKTRPLFAGDRWKDQSNTIPGSYDVCLTDPSHVGVWRVAEPALVVVAATAAARALSAVIS